MIADVSLSSSSQEQLYAGDSTDSARTRQSCKTIEILNINISTQGNEGHNMSSIVLKAGCMNCSIASGIAGFVDVHAAIRTSDDRCVVLQEIGQASFLQVPNCFNI
jgi:hypothetical protein